MKKNIIIVTIASLLLGLLGFGVYQVANVNQNQIEQSSIMPISLNLDKKTQSSSQKSITNKDAEITCGDFTFNFDANQLQVGILDGIRRSFDSITGVEIKKSNMPEPMATEFLNYTKESRTCGKNELNLRLYPKNTQLGCFACGDYYPPIVLSKYNTDPVEGFQPEYVKVQNITKPNISNAQVRELKSDGRGPNKHHSMEFIFDYQGQKYMLANQNTFVPDDLPKAEVDKYIKDFEQLVEDFEVKGGAGQNIWDKYIPQSSNFKCGDFSIKYDPNRYQVGLSYGLQNPEYKIPPEDESGFRDFIMSTRSCGENGFGGLYLVGTKAFCWRCDGGSFPSVSLSQTREPENQVAKEDFDPRYIKVLISKPITKKSLQNAKIIEYESGSYVRPKETNSALSFDYTGKHYLLQLQESHSKSESDFKSSAEYDQIFNGLVEGFEVV